MKSLNKKLYSVIIVCLLLLCFSVGALANNDTTTSVISSTPSTENAPSPGTSTGDSLGTDSGSESGDTESGDTESDSTEGEDTETSEDTSVSEESSSVVSQTTTSYSDNTNQNNYQGNIGGEVYDEADTSGWGDGDNKKAPLVSAGTTKKKANKNITDYSEYLWFAVWTSLIFIVTSIIALVCVNRKSFLKEKLNNTSYRKRTTPATDKDKRKNNHRNRTNIYRPRD